MLYVLASFCRASAFSAEAGLKYFILGALSSGLYLFGTVSIYEATGSLSFDSLTLLLANSSFLADIGLLSPVTMGAAFILAGLFFKI
jgi:NADH-quinone oxidoreductase subunit N